MIMANKQMDLREMREHVCDLINKSKLRNTLVRDVCAGNSYIEIPISFIEIGELCNLLNTINKTGFDMSFQIGSIYLSVSRKDKKPNILCENLKQADEVTKKLYPGRNPASREFRESRLYIVEDPYDKDRYLAYKYGVALDDYITYEEWING